MGIREPAGGFVAPRHSPTATRYVVAVSGHRHIERSEELLERIRDGLASCLRGVTDETIVVVRSGYAEGADRLVSELARELVGRLEVEIHLPLEIADYERDFEEPLALEEFRCELARATRVVFPAEGGRSRPDAYMDLGRSILSGADVLLAVWDGLPARGVGGTADVVSLAIAANVRITIVDS